MNSVIEKLAEVETRAETIVEHARQQKSEIERQIQEERDQFDRDLEEETQKKLEKIKEKSQQEVAISRYCGFRNFFVYLQPK